MSENKEKSVLIIENDDAILSSLSNKFKKKDILVITAKDGYEGYTRACKESPDWIVSETLLPSMNGFRVARLLKFDERFKNTPLILITSTNVDSVQDLYKASGADQILGKPFRFRDLLEIIEGVEIA